MYHQWVKFKGYSLPQAFIAKAVIIDFHKNNFKQQASKYKYLICSHAKDFFTLFLLSEVHPCPVPFVVFLRLNGCRVGSSIINSFCPGAINFHIFFLARNFWHIKSEKDLKKKDLSLKLRFFQLCMEFYQQILIRLVFLRMNTFLGNFVYVYNAFWLIRLSSFCIPPASLPAHSPLLKSLPHTYAFDLVLRPKEFYALDGWGRDLKDSTSSWGSLHYWQTLDKEETWSSVVHLLLKIYFNLKLK